jgi:hypothetical protein
MVDQGSRIPGAHKGRPYHFVMHYHNGSSTDTVSI